MNEEFVSEPIVPVAGTFYATAMTRGEPSLPGRFVWRDREYAVAEVLAAWKETGPCRSGGNEQYLRKHWFKIRTDNRTEMTIYFQRQARTRRQDKQRWWLYTVRRPQ